MINLNKRIKITLTGYAPQFRRHTLEYYNTKFYVISASLEEMFQNKYAIKDCICAMRSFKAVIC